MYDNKRIVAIIPARGGSKGIPGKNLKDLAGKPLIAYTVQASLGCKYIDNTIVSTDSERIASISVGYGAKVPFLRPIELASDVSKTIDAIVYTLNELKKKNENYDVLVLLQPTSPLRDTEDIDNAIQAFFDNNCENLVSVSPVREHPLLMRYVDGSGKLESILGRNSTCRRQDFDQYYRVNGAIYILAVSGLSNDTSFNDAQVPFFMNENHSVDIDTLLDFKIAELIMKNQVK